MTRTVSIVPHTHWDREWYERFEGYRARLVPMISRLLDVLERDPEFRSFTFDGQTIPIQDHLEKRPEDRPRIEALVRADRLLIGPWHVLADLLLVSGESIIRNLQEGLRVSGEIGRAARVAYVADPFGHPAQIPQILRGFGYDTYVFARGMGDEGEDVGSEFLWEAPSGDRIRAAHLVAHYSNGLPLVGPPDEDAAALGRRVGRAAPTMVDRLAPYANGDALLFMVGAKLANVGIPWLLKHLVDAMDVKAGSAAAVLVVPMGLLVAYGLLRLSTTLFTELRDLVFSKATQGAARSIALQTFRHLHALSLRFHLERQTGSEAGIFRLTRGLGS